MKFEKIHGMTALIEDEKIIAWVLTTCNDKWCYDIVGAKTDIKPVDTYGEAINAALDDWMQIQVYGTQVAIVTVLLIGYYFIANAI